jgi:hypothetical protein
MTPVFIPRYLEPRKVPTNPRWCPYAKGSPREGQAPRSSNSVESHEPSPRASGAPLPAPLGRSLPSPLSSFRQKRRGWKSPKGGVNRAKLKFTKLITTTSRVSVRNNNESEREGAKQIASEWRVWHADLFYRGSVLANLLPVEVVTKTGSLSTLSLSQTVPRTEW